MTFQKKLLLKYILEIAKYIWQTCFFAKYITHHFLE